MLLCLRLLMRPVPWDLALVRYKALLHLLTRLVLLGPEAYGGRDASPTVAAARAGLEHTRTPP